MVRTPTMTKNHAYNTPDAGSTDWHIPLNGNFRDLDTDIEVRDVSANRGSYTPKNGSKFVATDTGSIYIGDGTQWAKIGSLSSEESIRHYINPGDSFVSLIEGANSGDIFYFRPGKHKASEGLKMTTNNVTLVVPNGAELKAQDNISEGERFVRVEADNVTIKGNGVIDGNIDNTSGLGGNGHEHIVQVGRYDIDRTAGFRLDGLDLKNAGGGDGIYINNAEECLFQNFSIDNARRNGISVIHLEDAIFDNFMIKNTGGNAPEAGFAFEPNDQNEPLDRITVSNGVTRSNVTHGLYVNTYRTSNTLGQDPCKISVENVTAANNGRRGFSLHRTAGTEQLHFSECVAAGNGEAGWWVGGGQKVRLDNCLAKNNGQASTGSQASGVVAHLDQGDDTTPADVWISGFEVYDDNSTASQKHPGLAQSGGTLRVVDCRVGRHSFNQDGFRSDDTGSTVEYALIDVQSGDAPIFSTNGGSTKNMD